MEEYKPSGSETETPSKVSQKNSTTKLKQSVNLRHNYFTPPSRYTRLRNPFEAHLSERFHTNVFSPSAFKVSSQQVEDKFKWSIDDISCIKPVDIDETAAGQCDHHFDNTMESHVQAKIDLFFSQSVVPSPFNNDCKPEPLVKEVETPIKDVKRTCEVSTQTALSLPMDLPPELEKALQPYFNPEELKCVESSNPPIDELLYKKLFDIEECDRSDGETIESSPPKSLHLSPLTANPSHLHLSPTFKSIRFEENFDRDLDGSFNLDECNLSPISAHRSNYRERSSGTRIDFEERMSLDTTMNMVPDVCGPIPKTEFNSFTECNVSMKEANTSNSSGSVINWDVEYNKIEVSTPVKNNVEMDVSNSNTPKSSFGYRKKLSASFANEEIARLSVRNFTGKSYADNTDLTDLGYQTGATTVLDDNLLNIYASTPSKKLSYNT
nr:protein aurora borealis [Onthophagus taurus]